MTGAPAERPAPTARDVWRARQRIHGHVRRTPLIRDTPAADGRVWIKDETGQPTGSFKVRGAANALLALAPEARARGVVAVSTGNHGRAVAHLAREMGAHATVFVSERVPIGKLSGLEAEGAEVRIGGRGQDDAEEAARTFALECGATLIPPFDHPDVIAGQGTIGLELIEDLPDVQTVVVPVSGGGLIVGIALAIRATAPNTRIVGVSMRNGAVMHASLKAGRPVALPEEDTLADSLQGGLGGDNRYTFGLVRELVDDLVLVSEEAIAESIRHGFRAHRRVLEGGGAAALAAVRSGTVGARGATVVIASGANIETEAFARILSEDQGGPRVGTTGADPA